MKNKLILIFALGFVFLYGCKKTDSTDSKSTLTSLPFIADVFVNSSYVFGVGSGMINSSIPDTIAIAVDSVVGFTGGFGGYTGKDSIYILKSDLKGSWPDTTSSGGFSIDFEKFNASGYKAHNSIAIVLASPIPAPNTAGPTDLAGTYLRPSNGVTFPIVKVFDGVFVISNPGGSGAVAPNPYLLYNYKSKSGQDSLVFPIQTNPCGGGIKLVSPGTATGLAASEYNKTPPLITANSPLTLSWKILEFTDNDPTAVGATGLCQWGGSDRVFVKQ